MAVPSSSSASSVSAAAANSTGPTSSSSTTPPSQIPIAVNSTPTSTASALPVMRNTPPSSSSTTGTRNTPSTTNHPTFLSSRNNIRSAAPAQQSASTPSNPAPQPEPSPSSAVANGSSSSPAVVSTLNPSTRILSTANLSTPVPSSASSSATFLTGRSQPGQASGSTARAAPAHFTTRLSQSQSDQTIGRHHASEAQPGFYRWPGTMNTASHVPFQQSFLNTSSFFSTATASGHNSIRGSPTPRGFQNHQYLQHNPGSSFLPSTTPSVLSPASTSAAGVTPTMISGVPGGTTSPPSGLQAYPTWYRHPTSGLLPLLEVPSAYLSSSAAVGSNSPHTSTNTSVPTTTAGALLRNSAALTSSNRPNRSSAAAAAGATTVQHPPSSVPAGNPLHSGPIAGGAMAEDTVVSFSWVIGELALLRDEVERSMPPGDEGRSVSAGAGRNPVWTTQPCFGDPKLPKWKLELVRTQRAPPPLDDEDETHHHRYSHGRDASGGNTAEPGDHQSRQQRSAPTTPGTHAENDGPILAGASSSADGTPRAGQATVNPRAPTTVLSVYLTSLALEYLPSDALIPATIMLGLQPARTTLSRLQSRNGGWLWQSYHSFVFRHGHGFFECHTLPSLSEMLETFGEDIVSQDAIKLTVQIGCGPGIVGGNEGGLGLVETGADRAGSGSQGEGSGLMLAPFPRLAPFQVPSAHYVSQTILDALEGLVDCARTGDVRIIVRERGLLVTPRATAAALRSDDGIAATNNGLDESQDGTRSPVLEAQRPYVIPYPVGSCFPLAAVLMNHTREESGDDGIGDHSQQSMGADSTTGASQNLDASISEAMLGTTFGSNAALSNLPATSVVVRDRIIWAHSSVLRARSQYFADMIDSSFAEAQDEHDEDEFDEDDAFDAGQSQRRGPRRAIKTFHIPDSEWATVYWLIRYLYLEEIEFASREDVRGVALDTDWMISAEGLYPSATSDGGSTFRMGADDRQAGWRTRAGRDGSRGSVPRKHQTNWEWRTIEELLSQENEVDLQEGEESEHVTNRSDGTQTGAPTVDLLQTPPALHGFREQARSAAASITNASPTTTDRQAGSKPSSTSSPTSSWRGHPGTIYSSAHPPPPDSSKFAEQQNMTASTGSIGSHGSAAHLHAQAPLHQPQHRLSVGSSGSHRQDAHAADFESVDEGFTSASATPVIQQSQSSHQPRSRGSRGARATFNDPHEHPALQAPPASALATYKLAHRYGQAGLAELAKAHIVETLTPETAFPVLLATALYANLHEAIKRYVYEHWVEVSHTVEFEKCCDEVGAGEWGAEAGRSLRIFMQSLLSPARILLASPPQR